MKQTFFITSTVLKWIRIFSRPELADIVIQSLSFMIENSRIRLHGYVLMPNHLHLILTIIDPYTLSDFMRDFHKYTSQQIFKILRNENTGFLANFEVGKNDRKHQLWQETHAAKSVESAKFYFQKLAYIHNNPLNRRWQLCERPEQYPYSSATDYILKTAGPLKLDKIEC